jgi:hypothetical protein
MSKSRAVAAAVSTFGDLHARLSAYRKNWIFRGHASASWRLVPRGGRAPFLGQDQALFESWKRWAIEYLSPYPQTDWDRLAIAQHRGLATRLLDWTTNPLNAAYFAVKDRAKGPAVLFAVKFTPAFSKSAHLLHPDDPMTLDGTAIFRPRGVVARIIRQGGLFTIHNPPDTSLEDLSRDIVTLERIEIEEGYRARLRSELAFYGVSSASLFPDLDGLSSFLNWTAESGELSE